MLMKSIYIIIVFLFFSTITLYSQKGDPVPIWLNGKVDCDIKSYYINNIGTRTQSCDPKVKVVVKKERLIRPLLNQVYFQENSYVLDTSVYNVFKNSMESNSFDEATTLSFKVTNHNDGEKRIYAYRYVLDIIAKRFVSLVKEDKAAALANSERFLYLYGYSTSSELKHNHNDMLSKQRAKAVADYFINVWQIDEKNIKVLAGESPKIQRKSKSSPKDSVKIDEENRTVLILTDPIEDKKPIPLSPVEDQSHPLSFIYTDESKTQNESIEGYANHFRFEPNIDSSLKDSIRTIDFIVMFNKDTIFNETDIDMDRVLANRNVAADSIKDSQYKNFTWKFDFDDETKYPLEDASIRWELVLNDKNGKQYFFSSDPYEVTVEVDDKSNRRVKNDPKSGGKVNVYTYWMQLFDFGDQSLRPIDKEQIVTVCNQKQLRLTPREAKNIKISIRGFADKIGSNSDNKKLSQKRAEETEVEIRNLLTKNGVKNFPMIEAIGDGAENDLQIDNSTPQGRAYSRTVQIEITLPLLGN